MLAYEDTTHVGLRKDGFGRETIPFNAGDVRHAFDAFLYQTPQAPDKAFDEETWGASEEAQAKSNAMMSLVGAATPARRRGRKRGV